MVSMLCLPLSTKSPINKNLFLGGGPPTVSKSLSRSQYQPWKSPQTQIGASSSSRLVSFLKISCTSLMIHRMALSCKLMYVPTLNYWASLSWNMVISVAKFFSYSVLGETHSLTFLLYCLRRVSLSSFEMSLFLTVSIAQQGYKALGKSLSLAS